MENIEDKFYDMIISHCDEKKDLLIEEYGNIFEKLEDGFNLTFFDPEDTSLDIVDEFIDEDFNSLFFSLVYNDDFNMYTNDLINLNEYNKSCKNKIEKMNKIIQLYHLKLPTDLIGVIKNYI